MDKLTQKPKRGPGQPTKLNEAVIEKLSGYIGKGNYLSTACQAVGISYDAYRSWLERAEDDQENGRETLYSQFIVAIKRAEGEAEASRVARIEAAGIGGGVSKRRVTTFKDGTNTIEETFNSPQWLADMTHLERRHPDRWGRKDRHQVEINESKNITITHVEVVKDYGPGQAQIVESTGVEK